MAWVSRSIQNGRWRCPLSETVSTDDQTGRAERLYDAQAAPLILYGRALGLSHAVAEDVLHETFRALLELGAAPARLEWTNPVPALSSMPSLPQGWTNRLR